MRVRTSPPLTPPAGGRGTASRHPLPSRSREGWGWATGSAALDDRDPGPRRRPRDRDHRALLSVAADRHDPADLGDRIRPHRHARGGEALAIEPRDFFGAVVGLARGGVARA